MSFHNDVSEVHNPFTGACIGTVPKARIDDVRAAFARALAYKPRLSRYERHSILQRAAEIVVARSDEISELITSMLVVGRIAPKNSPCALPTASLSFLLTMNMRVRTTSWREAPAFPKAVSMFLIVCTACA